ncbi:hypothetical protein B0H11DRAFT_2198967 [Mycena galericulata]|nr:hypothetical protein B0H11DRAFT_2198967 [Mycena galericulata]
MTHEGEKLHLALMCMHSSAQERMLTEFIADVKNQDLPSMRKKTMLGTIPRRLYAVLSVEDVLYEMPSLDPKAFCKPSSALEVKLLATRSRHEDLLVAHAQVQLDPHSGATEFNVFLTPSVESGLLQRPVLVFEVAASSRFTHSTDVDVMRASLDVNPKLIKAFGYISLLIEVGTAISERPQLNPLAKAVMGLVGIARSKFERFITQNESVLRLVEEVGRASALVADCDVPELDRERPNQRRVSQALSKQLSRELVEAVGARRQDLANLAERMKSNQQLDTQVTVFNISAKVTELHDHSIINSLRSVKDAGPNGSKACLADTRVAILSRIRDWALHPTSLRTLLLHGAAGKGKSAIVHTISRELQSRDLAVVPLFAFNRSVPDRSSSQLIPSWAKHLAQLNPKYLLYLHTLHTQQLESSDIVDQRDALLTGGLASGINDGRPLIFAIDGLDECPKGEATQLFRILQELLSDNLPPFVRFLFTYRSDEEILRAFAGPSTCNIPIDNEEGTAEDIRKFVHAQLYRNPDVADMVEDVAKAAQTLFECAAALCRELTSTRRRAR